VPAGYVRWHNTRASPKVNFATDSPIRTWTDYPAKAVCLGCFLREPKRPQEQVDAVTGEAGDGWELVENSDGIDPAETGHSRLVGLGSCLLVCARWLP
jgi:hypothetical protein